MPRHDVLRGAPLLIAHRGGSGLAPENTLAAFRNGVERWGADMIELDVQASADGHCVVIHDFTLERTTNGTGPVAALPLARLQQLDAGHAFTRDGGATFPFRERGVRVPTIDEVLEALPDVRITIEVKAAAAQEPLFRAITRFGARDRIILAGMYERDRTQFHRWDGALSGSLEQLLPFYLRHRCGLGRLKRPPCDVVQIPERWRGMRLVSPRMVRDLHAHDIPLHVWTVNEIHDMNRLLDWGVEGLISDHPDVLGRLLHERVGRPLARGHTERA
jgi:glycerophosphoryl diester phosphodiesterase